MAQEPPPERQRLQERGLQRGRPQQVDAKKIANWFFFNIFLHKQEFPDRLQAHKDQQRPLQGGLRGLNIFLKLISPICGEARCVQMHFRALGRFQSLRPRLLTRTWERQAMQLIDLSGMWEGTVVADIFFS